MFLATLVMGAGVTPNNSFPVLGSACVPGFFHNLFCNKDPVLLAFYEGNRSGSSQQQQQRQQQSSGLRMSGEMTEAYKLSLFKALIAWNLLSFKASCVAGEPLPAPRTWKGWSQLRHLGLDGVWGVLIVWSALPCSPRLPLSLFSLCFKDLLSRDLSKSSF